MAGRKGEGTCLRKWSAHCGGERALEWGSYSTAVQLWLPLGLVARSQATCFISLSLGVPICAMGMISSLPSAQDYYEGLNKALAAVWKLDVEGTGAKYCFTGAVGGPWVGK